MAFPFVDEETENEMWRTQTPRQAPDSIASHSNQSMNDFALQAPAPATERELDAIAKVNRNFGIALQLAHVPIGWARLIGKNMRQIMR